jgi:hypothetical protein
MPKDYSIRFLIEDALAQAAVRRSVAGMEAIERAANRAAGAIQRAHGGGGGAGAGGAGGTGGGAAPSPQARAALDLDALQDRLVLKDYKRRVAYEKMKIEEAERLATASATRQGQMIRQSLAVAGTVGIAGLKVLIDGYEKIRNDAMEAADATLRLKKNLRVEGALKGDATPEQTLAAAITFRARTGLGEKEATEFTKQYMGTTPIAFEKGNITEEVAEDLKHAAGTRAARIGGEAGTHGELAGILGQFAPVTSARAGLSQLEAIRVGLVKGRGDDSPLTRQMLNVAGSLAGEGHAIPSLPELAALIGVTSLSGGPGQAADRANQLYRGLKIGLTKQTKVRGTDQAQGAYLKGLGVGEKDTLEQTLDKIVPDLQRAKDAGRDLDAYLASKNFRASDQRRAIIETFENYAPLKERMKEAREAGLDETLGAGEMEKNRQFIESTSGREAVKDALKDAAQITRGSRDEPYKIAYEAAEASAEIQRGDESQRMLALDVARGLPLDPFHPAVAGRRVRVESKMARDLRARATAAGVKEEEYSALDPTGIVGPSGPKAMEAFVNKVESLIVAKGGSMAIDIKPGIDEMNRTLKEISEQLGPKAKAPEALPVAPRGGNARP